MTTLDSILHDLGKRNRVGIIKIDVEGAEVRVLNGSYYTLDESRPYIVISLHGESKRYVSNFLRNFDYRIIIDKDYLYAIPKV